MGRKYTAEAALYLKQQRKGFALCTSFPKIGTIREEITELKIIRL